MLLWLPLLREACIAYFVTSNYVFLDENC